MSFNIRSSLQGSQGEEDKTEEEDFVWSQYQDDKAGSGATGRAIPLPLRNSEVDIGALSSLLTQIGRNNSIVQKQVSGE